MTRVALRSAPPRDLARLRDALHALPHIGARDRATRQRRLSRAAGLTRRILGPDGSARRARWSKNCRLRCATAASLPRLRCRARRAARSSSNAGQWLIDLETRERAAPASVRLKVGYNRVHGYYLESNRADRRRSRRIHAAANAEKRRALHHAGTQSVRRRRADRPVESAGARATAVRRLCSTRSTTSRRRCVAARPLCGTRHARVDGRTRAAAQSRRADAECRTRISIEAGRHPIVEHAQSAPFIANDLALDDTRRMLIVTGPNMGGKSTYMRQAALIVLLAYTGSFVPARCRAHRSSRSHLHAHRRRGRFERRPLDLHGRNERGSEHPAQRDAA